MKRDWLSVSREIESSFQWSISLILRGPEVGQTRCTRPCVYCPRTIQQAVHCRILRLFGYTCSLPSLFVAGSAQLIGCAYSVIISPLLRPLVHRLSGISISFSPIICLDFSPPSDARSVFPQPALPALCVRCLMGRIGRKPPVSMEVKLAHLRERRQRSASSLVSFVRFPFAPQRLLQINMIFCPQKPPHPQLHPRSLVMFPCAPIPTQLVRLVRLPVNKVCWFAIFQRTNTDFCLQF